MLVGWDGWLLAGTCGPMPGLIAFGLHLMPELREAGMRAFTDDLKRHPFVDLRLVRGTCQGPHAVVTGHVDRTSCATSHTTHVKLLGLHLNWKGLACFLPGLQMRQVPHATETALQRGAQPTCTSQGGRAAHQQLSTSP